MKIKIHIPQELQEALVSCPPLVPLTPMEDHRHVSDMVALAHTDSGYSIEVADRHIPTNNPEHYIAHIAGWVKAKNGNTITRFSVSSVCIEPKGRRFASLHETQKN